MACLETEEKTSHLRLRLYVAGSSPNSLRALTNIRRICEEHFEDHYDLEVVDLYKQPALAKEEQIVAAPTLVKRLPPPLRKIIGDLSNTDRVLRGLGVVGGVA